MQRFLLLGTDTDIGKTTACAALCAALLRTGRTVVACKPVETGSQTHADLKSLQTLLGAGERLRTVAGIRYELAAAPSAAARDAGERPPSIAECAKIVRAAEDDAGGIVVETCGGALTPLSASEYVGDLAASLPDYRVILVAGLRLGVLSHSFSAAHYMRSIGRPIDAVILCDRFGHSTAAYVRSTQEDMERRGLHVAAFIPHGVDTDVDLLASCVGSLVLGAA